MLYSAINLGLLALAALALYGLGAAILRATRLEPWSVSARLAYALAFGLGTLVLVQFGLGVAGLLKPWTAWAMVALGLALLPFGMSLARQVVRALRTRLRQARHADWGTWAVLGLFAIQAGLHVLADLAPPLEGDTMNSYLLAPRYWVQAGRYWQPTHVWASTLPGHMMMLSAWGLLLRGTNPEALQHGYSLATLLSGFLMSLFLALAVYALARVRFSARVGVLAASLIFLMPDATYLAESGKVDLGWAFFETLALAALLHWTVEGGRSRRWLVLAGACSGLALGAKSQAIMSLPFLAGWIVIVQVRRSGLRDMASSLVTYGLVALVVGTPYLAYNAVVHHNPTYPVFASQFARLVGGTPSPRSELGTEVFYAWTPIGYLRNLWDASLGQPPPFYLGYWAGPAYLMLIPVGLLLGKRERLTDGLLLYAFLFSVTWFLTKQAVRHFLPGLVLLAMVSGYVLRRLDEEPDWLRHVAYAALIPSFAISVAFWFSIMTINGVQLAALGILTPEAYVARWADEVVMSEVFPDSEIMAYTNAHLPADARILTLHTPMSLYFSQDMVSLDWGDRNNLREVDDDGVLLDYMQSHRITHILVFKADLNLAEREPAYELPLAAQPAFYERYATLELETPRTYLYRLRP